MNTLIWCLTVANFAALAILIFRHGKLREELNSARQQLDAWGAAGLGSAANATIMALGRPALISVEILNPMELAVKESPLAKAFGSLTPELVRREVYKEIYKRLCVQLHDQGVVAEVRLHHAA